MIPLSDPKREHFASALSDGEEPSRAWFAAGHSHDAARALAEAAAPDIVARVAVLHREKYGDSSEDLVPAISRYMRWADQTYAVGTVAASVAARGHLDQAVLLKQQLARRTPLGADFVPTFEPEMSDEEWMAEFAPKSCP